MKLISYSLFGKNSIYTVGAIKNAQLVKKVFPGWRAIFYVAKDVPETILNQLRASGAILRAGDKDITSEIFWRFLVAEEPDMERFIVRDTDSRLIDRDFKAVQAWEKSGLPFHSVRDHPYHTLPFGGGLWGAVKGAVSNMRELILKSGLAKSRFTRNETYGIDQTFLTNHVWPIAQAKGCLQHDSCRRDIYRDAVPLPSGCKFSDLRFVGEIMNENDNPNPIHFQQRLNFCAP